MDIQKLKYPVGTFHAEKNPTPETLDKWIEEIASLSDKLENLVSGLSEEQLQWRYRPEGWNIAQVVHHLADSHMNSFIRFKLALTEDRPNIKPYFEDRWAGLSDATDDEIETSLMIIKGLHKRWVILLRSMSEEDFNRSFRHPEHGRTFSLAENTGLYSWHSRHHLGHITNALEGKGKYN